MGNRPDRRVFRRRRQRAGFVLLASLAIIVFGVLLFSGLGPVQETASGSLDRVKTPLFAGAPEVIEKAEQGAAESKPTEEEKPQQENNPQEQAAAEEPEAPKEPDAPPPPEDKTLSLTVPKIDLYDNVVYNSSAPETLDYGAAKLEQSGFPWQSGANTYISAHRLGWPGTPSHYQFYDLPLMDYGDQIFLSDANGTTYTYEVTEIVEVSPYDVWVSNPVADRDMISLQTCTENFGDPWTMGPTWSTRFVVRADKVDVSYA